MTERTGTGVGCARARDLLPDTLRIWEEKMLQISENADARLFWCNAVRYLILLIRSLALLLFGGRHGLNPLSDAAERCQKYPNWRF